MSSGIYRITCLINGKIYIGSAVNLKERWRIHKAHLNKNTHHNKNLQNSWNKYDEEYFDFDVIEYCEISSLLRREQYYLDLLEPEFNTYKTAGSSLGFKHSEETKEKISIIGIGRIVSEETKLKMHIVQTGRKYNKVKRRYSDEDIKDIRTNKLTLRQNAQEYGCCHKVIYNIKKLITYKDIK